MPMSRFKRLLKDYAQSKEAVTAALHSTQTSPHMLMELQKYKEHTAVLLADYLLKHADSIVVKSP